jgi:hypothetical protein
MLIFSMSVSVDGFVADREGAFGWAAPSELGGYLLGRRLYETMLVWETDPSLRDIEPGAAFADIWSGIPKVVFSRTLDSVHMFRHPVVLGGGTPYLRPVAESLPLDLIENRTFGSRVIFERYVTS